MSTAPAEAAISGGDLVDRLVNMLGAEHVLADEADRRFYSTDVFSHTSLPAAVVRPDTLEEIQAVVRLCASAGLPVVVRGGGASYTDGYLHVREGGITIDTVRFDRIVEINENNATVTVEAGCSWAKLHEALSARGLRTPFWGPFSGLVATVGGSMSQHAISHGTGAHGISAESVLSFDIVTGTGELLRTGSAGSEKSRSFFRFYGPDLTGLFTGDCGALGIKAHITLPLIRRHEAFEAASFSFDSFEALHRAMRQIAIEGVDDENFGLDAALQQGQIGRQEGMSAKAEIAKSVMKSASSIGSGVKQLAKMAAAGDRALRAANYVAHYIVDGVDAADARAKVKVIQRIGSEHGTEIANSVPTVVRGMPFAPLTNTLGPKGERWVPLHGLFAHDAVAGFHQALTDYWSETEEERERLGIYTGAMFMGVGSNAFVYEPTFYWPDERTIYHERVVPQDHLANVTRFDGNETARHAVKRMKSRIVDLMHEHGAAHFQVGKVYPYLRGRNAPSVSLLRAIKAELDPENILNPGALGL
jgi:D-lactate dehydrogenase (cytochrome)